MTRYENEKQINVKVEYVLTVPEDASVEEVAQEVVESVYKYTTYWRSGRDLTVKAEHATYPFERCTIKTNNEYKRGLFI